MLAVLLLACGTAPLDLPAADRPPEREAVSPAAASPAASPEDLTAPPAPAATPPAPLTPWSTAATADVNAFLARHAPVPAPPLDHDPATAKYLDILVTGLGLTANERAQIARDGMVVTRSPQQIGSHAQLYRALYGHDLPVLITLDSVWFAYQDSYESGLRQVQSHMVRPRLSAAIGKLRAGLPSVPEASRADIDVLLTIAAALEADSPRYGDPPVPVLAGVSANQPEVDRVLALIKGQTDVIDELFGRERSLPLSRLRAQREHDDSSSKLWKAATWLQTARFVLIEDGAPIPRETADALALSALVQRTGADKDLAAIEKFLDAVLGLREGLAPDDVRAWSTGSHATEPAAAAIELAARFPNRTRLRSVQPLSTPPADRPRAFPLTFSLIPARYTPDGEVFTAVTNDAVRFDGTIVDRPTPSPLDVLFALGNDAVGPLLAEELRARPYHQQLEVQRARFDGMSAADWQTDIHTRWLDVIRSSNIPDARRPPVFDSMAGRLRLAQTQLAAWTWLRADHAMFAEETGDEGGCSFPDIYVDPYPETWRKLGRLARTSAALFRAVDNEGAAAQIAALERVAKEASGLADAADSLLETGHLTASMGKHLNDFIVEEHQYSPTVYTGWYADLFATEGYFNGPGVSTRVFRGSGGASPSLYVGVTDVEFLIVTVKTGHGATAFAGPVQGFGTYTGDGPPANGYGDPSPWTEPAWLVPLRAEPRETEWRIPPRDAFTVDFPPDADPLD